MFDEDQQKKDLEDDISDNKKTFDIFKQMADSISEMLTWEPDIPENHHDGKLPMLDLKLYMEDNSPFLRHSFYKK